ncbi:hypothetical protein [Allochromatium vinosum]|uniref:Uncharacterized protein n=1 Tax=Allochromatium vinosum (strain ATCC 17899 / DSM 180 / NBRC 103801 / NCIMB 10441 / D) TaxID=572477 RepID=D3RWH4_ALLVD|nr:hypothetical protein [Allochromatium vinosum]ADC64186.1 hypothetical protein Alvin_3296 [Allochromatium vinosum DSM 180]
MRIIKSYDPDTGNCVGVTLADPTEKSGASISVFNRVETDVKLPLGWYLFSDGRGEYALECRPTDADILAELTYLLAEVQDSEDETLLNVFRRLSGTRSPLLWREFATDRMTAVNESRIERAAQEIVDELNRYGSV